MRSLKLITVAVVAALGLTATGCSSSSDTKSDGPVTLTYAMWQQDQVAAFEKIFAEFTRQNPEISVKIQLTPFAQYFAKRQNEAANGTLPDVFWLNPYHFPLYASEGVIAPIDEKVSRSGFDLDAIPEGMRSMYSWDGKLYSLPNNRTVIVVYYNKDLFAKAKLPEPKPSWTWQEFQDTARKLTDPEAGVYGTAVSLDQGHVGVQTTIPQAGGYVLSPDKSKTGFGDPKTVAGVRYLTDMIANGSAPKLSTTAQTDMNSLFFSSKVAMLYQGSWFANAYSQSDLAKAGKIGVVTVPHGPAGNATPGSSLGNVMPAKAKHPEQSYKLIEFLGSKAAAEIYSQEGVGLTAYRETDQNYVGKFTKVFDLTPVTEAVKVANPLPASLNSSVWLKQLVDDLTPAFEQKQSAEQACAKLATDMQGALDQEKRKK
ncbi:ABC transporter substrate-binding protein [Micromonospora coxensis]|uniref:Multiple sugar transport system substrate-binding protein n=1 Tax=Micromonospora coxensis TaxID=356852 RepID=A0A1C5GVL4_9ACTN|nr:sugar ABC transporter substrate-binding protein [Micromonospora coxensis]SCG37753.1 multiple sugar transport system substrate-binding protein [Micromonospora coxensis]